MAQENGRLNASGLKALSVGGRLTPGAADAFEQLRSAGSRAGVNVTITSAADAYRLYEIQERIFTERYQTAYTQYAPGKVDRRLWQGRAWFRRAGTAAAAVPGTSNHGWALAVDIANVGGFNSTFYRWLTDNAPLFGFSNTEGHSVGEAWHWVYSPTLHASHGGGSSVPGTTTPPTFEEDTMSAAGEAQIIAMLEGITIDARDSVREGRARDKKIDGVVIDARDAALGARRLPGITIDARDGVLGNRQILAELAGVKVALNALATGKGLDPKVITAAVDAGVASALARVETTVTVKPEGGR